MLDASSSKHRVRRNASRPRTRVFERGAASWKFDTFRPSFGVLSSSPRYCVTTLAIKIMSLQRVWQKRRQQGRDAVRRSVVVYWSLVDSRYFRVR